MVDETARITPAEIRRRWRSMDERNGSVFGILLAFCREIAPNGPADSEVLVGAIGFDPTLSQVMAECIEGIDVEHGTTTYCDALVADTTSLAAHEYLISHAAFRGRAPEILEHVLQVATHSQKDAAKRRALRAARHLLEETILLGRPESLEWAHAKLLEIEFDALTRQ